MTASQDTSLDTSEAEAIDVAPGSIKLSAPFDHFLPDIDEEDRKFIHYNPNTSDLIDFIKNYARAALVRFNAQHSAAPMTPEEVRDGIADFIETNWPLCEMLPAHVAQLVRTIEIRPGAGMPKKQQTPTDQLSEDELLALDLFFYGSSLKLDGKRIDPRRVQFYSDAKKGGA